MLTTLAAVAELERANSKARQLAGIQRAKAEGKALGLKKAIDDRSVAAWRQEQHATIVATATYFGISTASMKRACRLPAQGTINCGGGTSHQTRLPHSTYLCEYRKHLPSTHILSQN
jgi:DNA invertase Pin-like site-specific DNA recombinase